ILEICGLEPEHVIAEMEARPAREPEIMPTLQEAFDLAGDDALRLGQTEVRPENVLIGMFRVEHSLAMEAMQWARVDRERLRAEIGGRVIPASDRVQGDVPPRDVAAQAAVNAAIAIVRQRKGEIVNSVHVLRALCDADDAFLSGLLARCGSSIAKLRERLSDSVL
ncbi:MAG: Clp protease N-terminal domain-containing protein, partial [bacterium]